MCTVSVWTLVIYTERIFSLEIVVSIYGDHDNAYVRVLVLEMWYLIELDWESDGFDVECRFVTL